MRARIAPALAASILALAACGKKAEPPPPPPAVAPEPAPVPAATSEPASFVGRTWVVVESQQVAKGALRVFLPDGTLAMSDPGATPAFGGWRFGDGRLTIVEEGREYPTEILELSDRAFRIRMHGPGEPIEIAFAPAPQALPAAESAAAPVEAAAAPVVASLVGTAWRLEDLAGAGVLDRVQATLEFGEHYVIRPSIRFYDLEHDYERDGFGEEGRAVELGAEYNSGTNPRFLAVAELRALNGEVV